MNNVRLEALHLSSNAAGRNERTIRIEFLCAGQNGVIATEK